MSITALSPDFFLWVICLLFGAFCVWQACRITVKLGTAASASSAGTLQLHIGEWIRIATSSPAVAFFALAIAGGIALPAYYSYLYRPGGPNGYDTVTVYGSFASAQPRLCFQADAVTSSATGYVIKLPKQTRSIDFAIEPPNMLTATNLMIELDGPGVWYSVDNGMKKSIVIDHDGAVRIPDPIPIGSLGNANLIRQSVRGAQLMPLASALQLKTP